MVGVPTVLFKRRQGQGQAGTAMLVMQMKSRAFGICL